MSNANIFLIGALEVLVEMKKQGIPFNRETYLLAFAICYKLVSITNEKVFEMPFLSISSFFFVLKFPYFPCHAFISRASILNIFKS